MNNTWNKLIYKLWAPIYDYIFNRGPFLKARKQVFEDISFKSGDRVLFVGIGTKKSNAKKVSVISMATIMMISLFFGSNSSGLLIY
ncbi:hypothetical protein [Litchfieldia alkalitelluris]|uniref:hypothetical protein n=1 Tax=Litchfieldia alkalitelluris TaxID=304268 RepID=UPI000997ABC0|nr:hypothetical protein [Litchfieldia alkalitelluris]